MKAAARILIQSMLTGWLLAAACRPAGDGSEDQIPRPDLTHITESRLLQALSTARAEVEESPASAAAWGQLGDLYFIHGWPREAAICYLQASRLQPDEFRWHYFLGRACGQSDDAGAVEALEGAIKLDPGYGAAYVYCAHALRRLGRAEEAQALLERGLQADPDNPSIELGLGQLQLSARRYGEARRHLERSLALDPERGETHTALSQAHMAEGDREAARRHAELGSRYFEQGRMRDPLFATLAGMGVSKFWFHQRGKSRLQEGDYAAAVREYARATADGEEDPVIWSGYGAALLGAGRRVEAVEALERALECAYAAPYAGHVLPEDMRLIHTNLGHAYAVTGQLAQAEDQLHAALRLAPASVIAAYNLALLYQRGGKSAQALEVLSAVPHLEGHPQALKLYRTLGPRPSAQDSVTGR